MNINILFLTPDDNDVLEFIKFALESSLENIPIELYGARADEEAWDILEKNRINLIIADMDYDKIESYEFYDKLQTKLNNHIPFVFLSSKIEDQEISLLKGLDNFFLKPLDDKLLIEKIYEVLNIPEETVQNGKNKIIAELETLTNDIETQLITINELTQKVKTKLKLL